jgi:hypothetical protein
MLTVWKQGATDLRTYYLQMLQKIYQEKHEVLKTKIIGYKQYKRRI